MSTCNRLDLETLGSRPIMLKNSPGHWGKLEGWKGNRKQEVRYDELSLVSEVELSMKRFVLAP